MEGLFHLLNPSQMYSFVTMDKWIFTSSLLFCAVTAQAETYLRFAPQELLDPPIQTTEQLNWHTKNCLSMAKRADALLSTDGRISNNLVHMKIKFPFKLRSAPRVNVSGNNKYFPLIIGQGSHYAFELPYGPSHVLANYLDPENLLIVSYTAQGSDTEYRAAFQTNAMVETIEDMRKSCVE